MNSQRNLKILGLTIVGLAFVFAVLYQSRKLRQESNGSPSWQMHSSELASLNSELKMLADEITKTAGGRRCKFASDCHVTGLGAKTCDGYNNFLVYSTYDANTTALLSAVREFNAKSEKFNNLSMKVPPCGKPAKPVDCMNGACVLIEK